MPKATDAAGTYHRHGDPDPKQWDEQPTVTQRPSDVPLRRQDPAVPNSTFGKRAKAQRGGETKAVTADEAEDKSANRRRTGRAGRR